MDRPLPVARSSRRLLLKWLRRISQPAFLAQVRDVGEYLMERLEELNSPLITEVRGRGLIVGIDLKCQSAAAGSCGL